MITADIAYSYNRDVYCIPGRVNDSKSKGCLELIRSLKAQLVTNAGDIATNMGWSRPKSLPVQQPSLFIALNATEQVVVDLLRAHGSMHIDEITIGKITESPQCQRSNGIRI